MSAHPGKIRGVLPNTCPTGKLRYPSVEWALRRVEDQRRNPAAMKQIAGRVYLCPWCESWHTARREPKDPQRPGMAVLATPSGDAPRRKREGDAATRRWPRDAAAAERERDAEAKRKRARDKERRYRANQERRVWQESPGMILDLWALTDSPRWYLSRVYDGLRR